MPIEVTIPAVGESIASGTIAQWHKTDGELVDKGDILLTLDTDKVSTELEAEGSGTLKILVEEGEEVLIGAVVATIDDSGEAAVETGDTEEPEPKGETRAGVAEASPPAGEPGAGADDSATDGVSVSPTVRKYAEKKGIDLTTIQGTGKKGFITKRDVEEAAVAETPPAGAEPESSAKREATDDAGDDEPVDRGAPVLRGDQPSGVDAPEPRKRVTRRKMSALRRKIAEHLVAAQQTAAILTTFNECDLSAVMALRKQLQEDFTKKHGVKLGLMSFFIKAVVDALKTVPQLNARLDGEEIVEHHYFDIGVAVGTDRGLIVPVLRDCDRKTFAGIERDLQHYAQRARDGKIQFEDLQGGVFTVSNGGIYGSMLSTPILNPPQSGILGVHTIQERPVVVEGEVVIRPMMYLALSYDHRIVDGKEAVTFLVRVKQCIEDPTRLLVEA